MTSISFLFDLFVDKLVPFLCAKRGRNAGLDESIEDTGWCDMDTILPRKTAD